MKGYIYIMSSGYDPEAGRMVTDPIFSATPTLGACMPNIRRLVVPGDHIFVVSGSVATVQQYIVGGFEVAEKISAIEAFQRFPDYRMKRLPNGNVSGNIIVDEGGLQHALDNHREFARRIDNYIVGRNPVALSSPSAIERAREATAPFLQKLVGSEGGTPLAIMGRWHKLSAKDIHEIRAWIQNQGR